MRPLALLAFPLLACAQISDLATTDDGGQTYFSTAYRQKGSSQAAYLKIFRIAENGLQLFRQLDLSVPYPGGDSNFYLAQRPSLSGNGQVVGYTASSTCTGGSHCVAYIYDQGHILTASDRTIGPGRVDISQDGRSFALLNVISTFAPIPPVSIGDVQTGVGSILNGYRPLGDARQTLANGPVALLMNAAGSPVLWTNTGTTPVALSLPAKNARLNANGDMIVYEAAAPDGRLRLYSYSVSSRTETELASTPAGADANSLQTYFHPWLTVDGNYVSYILNGRFVAQSTRGGPDTALTDASDGDVVDAVISGWGNVAFAATSAGRLLRIDVATGARTELIAAVPHLEIGFGAQVPGGRIDVTVTGPPAGDPALLGAGAEAPIVARSGNTVTLQIPWEADPSSTVQLVVPGNPSAFEEVHPLNLVWGSPTFYTLPQPPGDFQTPFAIAAHEDFSALVSADSPARPGEIVHLYATGLGAVAPSIATGAVTPVGAIHVLQTPLTCDFRQGTQTFPADIIFAGLAPEMIGIEQVDVRIPAPAQPPAIQLECQSGQPLGVIWGYAQLPITTNASGH